MTLFDFGAAGADDCDFLGAGALTLTLVVRERMTLALVVPDRVKMRLLLQLYPDTGPVYHRQQRCKGPRANKA